MSSTIYVLLLLVFIVNFCMEMYAVCAPIAFITEFHISASVTGYLSAAGSAIAFCALTANHKFTKHYPKWNYPYNMACFIVFYLSGYLMYAIFYDSWIVFSFHLLSYYNSLPRGVTSLEMTTRCSLLLTNEKAFQMITGLTGLLMNIAYVLGSAIGPALFEIWPRLPFAIASLLNMVLLIVMFLFYYRRCKFLDAYFDQKDGVHGDYINSEEKYYISLNQNSSDDKEYVNRTRRLSNVSSISMTRRGSAIEAALAEMFSRETIVN
eukprot:747720_1